MRVFILLVGLWGGLGAIADTTCAERVTALADRAATDIRAAMGGNPSQTMVAARAQAEGEQAVREIVAKYERDTEELERLAAEAKACDGGKECLVDVGQRTLSKLALVKAVLWNAMGGEARAREQLLRESPQLARQWVDAHLAELGLVSSESEAGQVVTGHVSQELSRRIGGDGFRPLAFLRELGGHILTAFRPSTYAALWRNTTAWLDYKKNIATVLSIQVTAHVVQMVLEFLSGAPVDPTKTAWIYANTVAMMTIQAGAGALNTTVREDPPPIENYQQAMERLSGILHGNEGYWNETKRKLLGFFALLPLEYAVSVVAKLTGVAIATGSWTAVEGKIYETTLVNAVGTAILGGYFSLRWAFLDKWFNLNLLPALRDGTRNVVEAKLQEMKARGLVPAHWTVDDFYRLAVPAYRRGIGFWRRASSAAREDVAGRPAHFRQLFASDDALDFVAAYRQSRNAFRVEWAWRYGMCLVDSFVVFGVFGKWISAALGFPG